MELLDADAEATLATHRATLLTARAERIRPGLDDKILADWNGLMIAALAFAGEVFDRSDWRDAAASAFDFVREHMTVDGRLRHSWRDGRARHPATLDDYATMCRAALALYEATGDAAYVAQAEAWLDTVEAQFLDAEDGGYYFAAADTPTLITRTKNAYDNATPSGNGMLVAIFGKLYLITGNEAYRARADRIVAAFSGALQQNFVPLSTLLNGAEFLQSATQIVIAGNPGAADTGALADVIRATSLPNRLLIHKLPGTDLPETHPAAGKEMLDGKATAYVCHGMTCTPPITDPEALKVELAVR
jgi:uncharacterized protein YyaL (SSP411 family)